MVRKQRTYSGTPSQEVSPRELKNRGISRAAAAEGMVLMKNEGILPLSSEKTVSIYGNGVSHMIKGGTGSGDVNEREVVSVQEGLDQAGICLINKENALSAPKKRTADQLAWRDHILELLKNVSAGSGMEFFRIMRENPFVEGEYNPIIEEDVKRSDIVIYIISRIAGEGRDRFNKPGDYELSEQEKEELNTLSAWNENIVVLINTGGQIDLTDILSNSSVKAILYMSQGGMEAGNAVADVLTGKVVPSGKLTSTWSKNYSDFPSSATFSHNDGDVDRELYEEGIYVGYRYFDSFGVETAYPFGFGLSYTTFSLAIGEIKTSPEKVCLSVTVTNTGSDYAGKEVVQVYAACPQTTLKKEFKRLVGFAKTDLLAPGESQTVLVEMPAKNFASFSEEKGQWIIEAGEYALLVGNASTNTVTAGVLGVAKDVIMETVEHVLPLEEKVQEITAPEAVICALTQKWKQEAAEQGLQPVPFAPAPEKRPEYPAADIDAKACEIAEQLTEEELIHLLMGEITKGQDNLKDNELVETGIYVPGAAGETTCQLEEKYNIPAISMADGPAGLRLMQRYDVDRATGKIYSESILAALSGGLFSMNFGHENADRYYMYATAIPIGTLLAQTWNPSILEEIGEMIGGEMLEFGVTWWLAPGMNIHRNPLCGRNFEYYSEDPYIAGIMAAAITRGVQKLPGIGTTIKHYACNSQEDNRMFADSILSERALREIYLRGFEIAVKTSQPMCLMTSYNKINGVPAANNTDLITKVLRGEWNFQGIVMTDWTPTTAGSATSHGCMIAGNDLIMPGHQKDVADLRKSFQDGSLPREKAVECAARIIRLLMMTNGYEDAIPYGARFL